MSSHSIPSNAIPDLFKGVTFYIHDTIHPKIRIALKELLLEWGAESCPLPPSTSTSTTREEEEQEGGRGRTNKTNRFDIKVLTHFITDTLDFPEYSLLTRNRNNDDRDDDEGDQDRRVVAEEDDKLGDGKFKIVTPAWVTRSFDLQVLQQSRFYSPDPALFLSGTCICTTGLPITDDLTICSAVSAFGGQYRRELTREVTHLIAVSENGGSQSQKYEMAIKFGTELGIAIVLPHWFEESLKLNQLVPMDIYRFPNPPFSNHLRRNQDHLSNAKPFVERLTEYWKLKFPTSNSNTNPLNSTTTNSSASIPITTTTTTTSTKLSDIKVIPTTATHVILGLEQGLTLSTEEKLKQSEKYFKTSLVQQSNNNNNSSSSQGGVNVSALQKELLAGTTRDQERGRSRSQFTTTTNGKRQREHDDDADELEGVEVGIFSGKKFYLSSDLGLSSGIEKAICTKIKNFGGKVWSFGLHGDLQQQVESELEIEEEEEEDGNEKKTGKKGGKQKLKRSLSGLGGDSWARRRIAEKKLRESDYVVLRNREGWEFWLAYELELSIGTPSWLFYTFANQTLSSPLSKLVHYPPPSRDGIPEFKNKTITISNYTGLAREYVRTLIELLGAKYEGTMSRQTNFVVSSTDLGSKCLHAKNWNIPLVNHLWLESCILSWNFLNPSLSPNYTTQGGNHLEMGTMFPTILGWRSWTKESIRKWCEDEERKLERERGIRGVEELEKEEKERLRLGNNDDDEDDDEAENEGEEVSEGEEDEIQNRKDEEMMVDNKEEEEEEEEQGIVPVVVEKEKKPISLSKMKSPAVIEPVVEIDSPRSNGKNKKILSMSKSNSKSNSTSRIDKGKDEGEEEEEPTASNSKPAPDSKSRSKSSKVPSPAPPSVQKKEDVTTRKGPTVTDVGRTSKSSKSAKLSKEAPPPPPLPADENDSSALTEDDQEEDSKSTSSESSTTPAPPNSSAKAMSKHFNKIDPHNLVQPGSKRAAAGKARAALHVAMEDKNQFDLEQKSSARKGGGGIVKGRRSSQGRESGSPTKTSTTKKAKKVKTEEEDESDEEMADVEEEEQEKKPVVKKNRTKTKRASTDDEEEAEEEVEVPKKKKQKVVNKNLKSAKQEDATTTQEGAVSSFDNPPRAKPPPVKSKKIRIISTGLGLEKNSSEIKELKPLGALWTEKPQEATHLVVKNLSRTEKFLCTLPYAPFIVTKKWIDACIDAGELVDETPYLVKDRKKETEIGDTLEAILSRARKGKLFDGKRVYITKGVSPSIATMQKIVSASGGIIAPNDLKKQHKTIVGDPDALVVSSANERREWDKLASEGIPIYACEAVFVATMHQLLERGFTNDHRVDAQLSS